jgi:hypothetical protein
MNGCPAERRELCKATSAFFSQEDVHLHATCFGRPFQVGLLISEEPTGALQSSLFGWRYGMVAGRGYYTLTKPTGERKGMHDGAHATSRG